MTGIKIRLQKHVNRFQIMGRIIMALVIVVNADVNPPSLLWPLAKGSAVSGELKTLT